MSKGCTWQEIVSQPDVWDSVLSRIAGDPEPIRRFFTGPGIDDIVFTGCGSSYYIGLTAAHTFQRLLGVRSRAVPASEVLFYPECILSKGRPTAVIGVSRSGETTETLVALERVRNLPDVHVLGVSCGNRSAMAELVDFAIEIPEASEQSIVMTRSFSAMVVALQTVAAIASDNTRWLQSLRDACRAFGKYMDECIPVVERLAGDHQLQEYVFLGSGPLYGIACEASLKVHEMALYPSLAYHSLEYRHGPKSTAGRSVLVTVIRSDAASQEEASLLDEIRSLSARTAVVGPGTNGQDCEMRIPLTLDEWARSAVAIVPLQMLAYYRAVGRGLDPDQPRHLSQVVRLESSGLLPRNQG